MYRSDRDRELAVRLLGDHPSPRQRDALLEVLRFGIDGNDTLTASLARRFAGEDEITIETRDEIREYLTTEDAP